MPSGSVARSFPKEERELKALFSKGLKKLRNIEKQDKSDNSRTQSQTRTRFGKKGDATIAAKAMKRGFSSLAARGRRSSQGQGRAQGTAAARQRQLDASFDADSKENHALSGAEDVDDLFKSLNGKAPAEKKARTTQLSLMATPQRRWGVVYDPSATAHHALRGEAKKEFDRWSQLADAVDNVYDPTTDRSPFSGDAHRSTSWWKWSRGGDADKWWEHNHAGRGY